MTGIIGRDQNVRHSSMETKSATPKTIRQMAPLLMFAAEVSDENGRVEPVLAFRVGDVWYHDPAAKPWFDRLRPIAKENWLSKQLEERYQGSVTPAAAPKEDKVEILVKPAVK